MLHSSIDEHPIKIAVIILLAHVDWQNATISILTRIIRMQQIRVKDTVRIVQNVLAILLHQRPRIQFHMMTLLGPRQE